MNKRIIESNGFRIVIINSDVPIITDAQTAIDLLATVNYDDDSDRMAINKEAIAEGFFTLSTGIAGEVLQKVVNYRKKLAIVGEFSHYKSKSLHDFIYECNRGSDVFFISTEQEAIGRLSV